MDVVKTKPKSKFPLTLATIAAAIVLVVTIIYFNNGSSYAISDSRVVTAVVQSGPLRISVNAPGTLVPSKIKLISTSVEGQVEEIFALPGSYLEQGQAIFKMSNRTLEQQLQELRWELESLQAGVEAMRTSNINEVLSADASILDTKNQYEFAKLEYEAYLELERRSVSSASRIEMEKAKMLAQQLEEAFGIEQQKAVQLKKSLDAKLKEKQALVSRLEKIIANTEYQIAQLDVVSSISGTLQELSVELGQKVLLGESVARVAQNEELIAELKVPEHQASRVSIGQKVSIDTRINRIEGEVVRIDPSVVNGTIQVDVALTGELPNEAKPDLSINGEIHIASKDHSLFVKRPVFSVPNRVMSVFRVEPGTDIAKKVAVKFGEGSSASIEIVSGLGAGDEIIVSEYTSFNDHDEVEINRN